MISPEKSSKINADYISKLGSIRTNSDACNSYYNNLFDLLEMEAAKDYKKENKSNITEIIVAKNENGKTGTAKLGWMPEYCMFGNTVDFERK